VPVPASTVSPAGTGLPDGVNVAGKSAWRRSKKSIRQGALGNAACDLFKKVSGIG
jgi:hypothetical protein